MRLIDADKLKEVNLSICDNCLNSSNPTIFCRKCPLTDFVKTIDNAPTIEYPFYQEAYQTGYEEGHIDGVLQGEKLYARPQGEWLYPDADIVIGKRRVGKSYRVCSNCKESFSNNIPWNANFCPNCGAEVIKNETDRRR